MSHILKISKDFEKMKDVIFDYSIACIIFWNRRSRSPTKLILHPNVFIETTRLRKSKFFCKLRISKGSCHCVPSNTTVTTGKCSVSEYCNVSIFLGIYFLATLFHYLPSVAQTSVLIGVVPQDLKARAIGVNEIIFKVVGKIPAPIIGGVLIDK